MSKMTGKWLANSTKQEIPTGTVNGVNTSFTLSFTPNYNNSVMVYVNGAIKILTTDFSVSGTSITFVTAPASGSTVYAVYTME